jgi:hypothetical protein
VQQHKELLDDMQRVVQQWEDLQAGLTLGRLEIQLTELREFVAERLTTAYVPPMAPPPIEHRPSVAILEEPAPVIRREEPPAVASGSWEQLKHQLLGDAPVPEQPVADEPLPSPPVPVDFAHVPHDALVAAVEARDAYIVMLLGRLRKADAAVPIDWEALGTHAPEMAAECLRLRTRLDEQYRLGEVELSLERARLAREQTRLAQQQEQFDKLLKRLGINSLDDLPTGPAPSVTPPDRRWMRFLGPPKKP